MICELKIVLTELHHELVAVRLHSGVMKDARFSREFLSIISSSFMTWYAASFVIELSDIRHLIKTAE